MKKPLNVQLPIQAITECDKISTTPSNSNENPEWQNVSNIRLPVLKDVPMLALLFPGKMAKEYLYIGDDRTFVKWCKEYKVSVIKMGKIKYVNQEEFFTKLNAVSETIMKQKYGENWKEGLNAANQEPDIEIKSTPKIKNNHYQPKSKGTQRLLEKWKR